MLLPHVLVVPPWSWEFPLSWSGLPVTPYVPLVPGLVPISMVLLPDLCPRILFPCELAFSGGATSLQVLFIEFNSFEVFSAS